MLKRLARWVLRTELQTLKRAIQEPVVKELPPTYSHRIPRDAWTKLRTRLPPPVVGSNSTELQVAALVGQQQVIDLIERELVL